MRWWPPTPKIWEVVPAGIAVVGATLMIIAEFSTLYEIKVVTVVPSGASKTAGSHHGYALLVLALVIAVAALFAYLARNPYLGIAIIVLAIAALAIALSVDMPDLNHTGVFGERYDDAQAHTRSGFYLEVIGSLCALAGGAASVWLTRNSLNWSKAAGTKTRQT